jgi:hypothetical protein
MCFCDKNGIANPESPTGKFENVFGEADGKTLVTVISTHNSFEEIEMVIEMGFKGGFASSFENLPIHHLPSVDRSRHRRGI